LYFGGIMHLFPHTKNTSIKIITDTYDLERCFLSSHSQGSLQGERQLLLLNSLLENGFNVECDGEVSHFVEVRLTKKVRSMLNQLGKDDQ
ncbi:hypothetical protein, partial [Bacillus toyonensis]